MQRKLVQTCARVLFPILWHHMSCLHLTHACSSMVPIGVFCVGIVHYVRLNLKIELLFPFSYSESSLSLLRTQCHLMGFFVDNV